MRASDKINYAIVKDMRSKMEAMQMEASVNFDGWGAEAQAKIAMDSNSKHSEESVTIVAKRVIYFGPLSASADMFRLTDPALDFLKQNGPQEFEQLYGNYFIFNSVNGAEITLEHEVKCRDSSSK